MLKLPLVEWDDTVKLDLQKGIPEFLKGCLTDAKLQVDLGGSDG